MSFTEILCRQQVILRGKWTQNVPKIFPKLNLLQLVQPSQLHELLNEAVVTHPLKLHLRTQEQLHCFIFKYRQTYFNTTVSNRTHKKTKKKKKKNLERNETHVITCEISDGEPIAIYTTTRHHPSFSYAIKREYMRYF